MTAGTAGERRFFEGADRRRAGPVVLAAAAAVWGLVVLGWPRLPVGSSAAALGLQSSLMIAAASIAAGLVVLTVTVGTVAMQVLSQFSWRLNRTVLDAWLITMLSVAVAVGVALPLWVAARPSPALTRFGFASFGWSVLLIVSAAWLAARRIQPDWLVDRASGRAVQLVERAKLRPGPGVQQRLAGSARSLAELVASDWLPYPLFRKAVATYVAVLAARTEGGAADGDIVSAVRDLAAQGIEHGAGARSEALIVAVGGLGIAQCSRADVHRAVREALLAIALQLRTSGSAAVARMALDALADVVDARIVRLVPAAEVLERDKAASSEPSPGIPMFRAARTERPQMMQGAWQSSCWWPSSIISPDGRVDMVAAPERLSMPLTTVIGKFADGERIQPRDLAMVLAAPPNQRDREEDQPDDHRQRVRLRMESSEAYELLIDTAADLTALLPAPSPDAGGWPGGWRGSGELDNDVRRIAGLAASPYARGQYPPTSVAEETIEQIAGSIRREPGRRSDVPVDRTGWRDPPMAHEEGGAAAAPALSLSILAVMAVEAGFDRRALLTGRRILAAATSSAQAADLQGLAAHSNAIRVFARDAIRPLGRSLAGKHRQRTLLAGLIAESDQLLACQHDLRLQEHIQVVADAVVWSADGHAVYDLAAKLLQAKLAAIGWPVSLPGARHPLEEGSQAAQMKPLPAELLTEAEETIKFEFGRENPVWTAATVIALWVHAVVATRSGPDEAKRISALLRKLIREHDARHRVNPLRAVPEGQDQPPGTPAIHPQLRRLAMTAAHWCASADKAKPCAVPRARGASTLHAAAKPMLAHADFADWTYQGVVIGDDDSLVLVEEPDGSRRLLRDDEARARSQFAWGYGGNGPHALASALLADAMGSGVQCGSCLGGAPCGAGIVTCPDCDGTGERGGTGLATETLVGEVISNLPGGGGWELTRRSIVDLIARSAPRRSRPLSRLKRRQRPSAASRHL